MLVEVARDWGVPEDEYEKVFADYHLLPVLMEAKDISTDVRLARLRGRGAG